jgi:hypothetical protein
MTLMILLAHPTGWHQFGSSATYCPNPSIDCSLVIVGHQRLDLDVPTLASFVGSESSRRPMRTVIAVCVALCVLGLAGCDTQQWFKQFIPSDEASLGQRYLEDVRTRNFRPIENAIDPAQRPQNLQAALEKMASLFPQGTSKTVKVVGSWTTTFGSGATAYNLTYEYEFSRGWALGRAILQKQSGRTQIEGLYIQPLEQSLEQVNAFRLTGKSSIHYLILILAVALPLFTIATAVVCYRTPIPRRKWLWMIFILIAFGSITLNWTTGAIGWSALSFDLLGASFTKQFYGPLVLQISIPLGAAVFWARRRGWIVRNGSSISQSFK